MFCPGCGAKLPNDAAFCNSCGHEFIAGSAKGALSEASSARKELARREAKELQERRNMIFVSTGPAPWPFEVLGCIFAMDSHTAGFFEFGADPNKAFEKVKNNLIDRCLALNGDGVTNCQFEYRVCLSEGIFGKKQCVELFAYGTVVRKA